MRKKQVRPKSTKTEARYRKYSPDILLKAYEVAKTTGSSVRKVASQYGVPVQTLRDRMKGHVDANNCHVGVASIFTSEEELSIVEHIETMAQLGYGASNMKVRQLGGKLAQAMGKRADDTPLGKKWLRGFLKRWKNRISSIKPRSLDSHRARSATPETVNLYFDNLQHVIEQYGLTDKPQFIYNIDETGIQPEHKPSNIIAPLKSNPPAVTSPRSTIKTVIACANAAGNHIPPFFIYKGKIFNEELMKGSSPGAGYTMSETGWSNAQIFKEYLEAHFLPNVRRGVNDNQPILHVYDGHASHCNKQLTEWAISKNIVLFVLPAHTSHLLQPLDVGVFGSFKRTFTLQNVLHS